MGQCLEIFFPQNSRFFRMFKTQPEYRLETGYPKIWIQFLKGHFFSQFTAYGLLQGYQAGFLTVQ